MWHARLFCHLSFPFSLPSSPKFQNLIAVKVERIEASLEPLTRRLFLSRHIHTDSSTQGHAPRSISPPQTPSTPSLAPPRPLSLSPLHLVCIFPPQPIFGIFRRFRFFPCHESRPNQSPYVSHLPCSGLLFCCGLPCSGLPCFPQPNSGPAVK